MNEQLRDDVPSNGRQVLADRTHRFRAPQSLLFDALTIDQSHWLRLEPGEVLPAVLDAVPNERVVWSSFWPGSPGDTIELDLAAAGDETAIRFRWLSDSPPDERGIGITRQRLNRKLGSDLRAIVAEHYWRSRPARDLGR